MEHAANAASNPALTVSLALAAGLIAQAVAHHARLPGIVLLLAAGALLGPDVLNIVRPDTLGSALSHLVGFAVAVILFEGGLNLDLKRLQRGSRTIRRLITLGSLITAVGGALAARSILGWEWRPSILFGTLVIVTGPTVIGPLVRRIRLKKNLQTILEGEGVLIDPVGAIIAVVALDVALHPTFDSLALGVLGVAASLGIGSLLGLAGGWLVGRLLKFENFIPEGLENVFALSIVLALFHISNLLQAESGIAAVTVAGVVVGNTKARVTRDLMEFKEQLTVMFIGMLFVVLAADVRFEQLRELGVPGLLTVAALMFVVRPVGVILCSWGGTLNLRERVFLSWIAPRGIVAAAVASFFALELDRAGLSGGTEIRAMVFLVIAVTVTLQGLTGGPLASLLKVRRPTDNGWAILGANDLGLAVGRALRDGGEDVTFLDSNADASHAAEAEDFPIVFGNALEETTLLRAGIEGLEGVIGMTLNEEVNLFFATKARNEFKVKRCFATLHLRDGHITEAMIHEAGVGVMFGGHQDVRLWESCLRRELGVIERWKYEGEDALVPAAGGLVPEALHNILLPMIRLNRGRLSPVDETTPVRPGDVITFLCFRERRDDAVEWLTGSGWTEEVAAAKPETESTPEVAKR
ncbi:MAG: sodium/hydrogen antiporter [Gemmatimonadota bacterium]|nr:MAG: sodium/hydrogen antiporter [Gemmatimonadota bacterium]